MGDPSDPDGDARGTPDGGQPDGTTAKTPATAGSSVGPAAGNPGSETQPTALNLTLGVPIAVNIGWTMAVLFGYLRGGSNQSPDHLPTEHELPREQRIKVETVRLDCLLTELAKLAPSDDHPIPTDVVQRLLDFSKSATATAQVSPLTPEETLQGTLLEMNLELLEALACAGREIELAYQVGRSLRDTANPPVPGTRTWKNTLSALMAQLVHHRIATVQEWLATLDPHLPLDSAVVVGTSIGRWSDFCATLFVKEAPGSLRMRANNSKDIVGTKVSRALLVQGDVWLNLLTGTESTAGLLTPEAYVAAGEAALSRTVRIVRRILFHYWFALFVVAIALAAVLYVSARYLGGASKVWTQIAAIASALGVTAKGIGTGVAQLSEAAERPIYRSEELDAMAWAVTTLPRVKINNRGVRALRRSGIQGSGSLGHA